MPDVVYDRIVCRADLDIPAVKQTILRLKAKYPRRYFNPCLLDKWDVYQALAGEPSLDGHLPETHLPATAEVAREMAGRHAVLFIKPRAGTQGRGVIRLERRTPDPSGPYGVRRRGRREQVAPTLDAALGLAKPHADDLIQQGIENPWVRGGRPFDLRALLHRDGPSGLSAQDGWRVTCIVGRVGRRGGIVSNLHAGGTALASRRLLGELYRTRPGQVAATLARLRRLALKIPPVLERHFGPFGELAVDLLVDVHGSPWLLEANSRPGRRALVLAGERKARALAGRRIFRHARGLMGGDDG
jgi:hypothetical protein